MTADSDWKSAPIFKRKYGSQIWNFIAVESDIFVCESSSSSTGDSSLVENVKNICPQGAKTLRGDQRSGLLAESQEKGAID